MAGTLIVSLDFELFWGLLECFALEDYQENILGGRKAIPRLLKLFEQYGIHATWATVGFLFAESKAELQEFFPEIAQRPSYDRADMDPYAWFDKIGDNEEEAPCFFAPSLVKLIAQTPGQEIGSHTFCHYYCREKGQTLEQFAADLRKAREFGAKHGYDIKSLVLPRNQCEPEYMKILSECGFTSFRDLENDWVHRKIPVRILERACILLDAYLPLTKGTYHPKWENGICNLEGSKMYRPIMPKLRFLERVKMQRLKGQMRRAAKRGEVYHMWWHPHNIGVEMDTHFAQLEELLQYYQQLKEKYGMESLNMAEAAERCR